MKEGDTGFLSIHYFLGGEGENPRKKGGGKDLTARRRRESKKRRWKHRSSTSHTSFLCFRLPQGGRGGGKLQRCRGKRGRGRGCSLFSYRKREEEGGREEKKQTDTRSSLLSLNTEEGEEKQEPGQEKGGGGRKGRRSCPNFSP